jgi:hypothetical protein
MTMTLIGLAAIIGLVAIWERLNAVGVAIDRVGYVLLDLQQHIERMKLSLERIESNTYRPPIDVNAYPGLYGTAADPAQPPPSLDEINAEIEKLAGENGSQGQTSDT